MTVWIGIGITIGAAALAAGASILKNVLSWRNRKRDLAVSSVERYAPDLADGNRRCRKTLCATMLALLRADVEFSLAHRYSTRALFHASGFFAAYALYRLRLLLGFPPRHIKVLCSVVRRINGQAPMTDLLTKIGSP